MQKEELQNASPSAAAPSLHEPQWENYISSGSYGRGQHSAPMNNDVRIPTAGCLNTKYDIIPTTSTHTNLSMPLPASTQAVEEYKSTPLPFAMLNQHMMSQKCH